MRICGVLLLVAACALQAAGQAQKTRTTTVEMANPAHAAQLPYTAEYKITRVQTLAGGATISHESTEVVAVDSQGRRMTATTTVPTSGDQTPRTHVSVFDPVARTNSNWSVPGQKATVMAMPPPTPGRNCQSTAVAPATSASLAPRIERTKPEVEELGTETIQGIEAHGRRTIFTTPAGAIGNDEPLVRTSEMWTAVAPGLRGLMVREVTDDPQSGKMTKEMSNLTQAEPDASVFDPPAGYEIENKDAPVPSCIATPGVGQPMAPIAPPPPPEQ